MKIQTMKTIFLAYLLLVGTSITQFVSADGWLPGCSKSNLIDLGGDGTSPPTVSESLALAEKRLTEPSATLCSLPVNEHNINTFIQW
jgi:hypothetical protein